MNKLFVFGLILFSGQCFASQSQSLESLLKQQSKTLENIKSRINNIKNIETIEFKKVQKHIKDQFEAHIKDLKESDQLIDKYRKSVREKFKL